MKTKKILLVEDDLMLLSLLDFRLKKEGYQVATANDGKDAISKIKSDTPDLVISDIMMPFVSGLELTGFIKNECESEIPIVIISSAGQEEMVLEAFNLGADDFIAKPFSPNELIVRLKKMF
ncbi:response regulator transcription factor [Flavobacteriaceae bacterium]|nr:response regulator transcription factor [Flavobacteriaceae bacterium]MDB4289679.1 response regulator transcription factor [Flavobacteriaceae bacterium]MDB9874523.1 response regulator transcription factor [Flavobacteriaceae bacterium]